MTPADLEPAGRTVIGDSYDNATLSARLGAELTDTLGVGLVVRHTSSTLLFTGQDFSVFPSVPAAAQTRQDEEQLFTRGEVRLALFDGRLQNRFGLAYTDYDRKFLEPDFAPTAYSGNRVKLDWQGDFTLSERATLVLGLADEIDRLQDSPISAEMSDRAGFVELQAKPLANAVVAASLRYDDNDRFGGQTTWRLAPTYTIAATETQLKASYGTGFKAPSLTQLYVSYPGFNFFANPNLQPEESRGWDAGFEQPLLDRRLRFGATWYHNDIRNLIETNATATSYANIGRATTYGVESFASFAASERLNLRADYTYTMATDDTTGQELLRRPKHKASVSGTWRPLEALSFTATFLYVGTWIDGNRDFSIPRLSAGPYGLVNLAANYDLGHGVALFARIDNLLDRRYQDPVGFERPGFGLLGGMRVNFDGRILRQ